MLGMKRGEMSGQPGPYDNVEKCEDTFPFEITDVEPSLNKKLLEDFHGERSSFIQVGEKKWLFPRRYREHAASFYNLEVRPSDVWIVTFPRSGTTVTKEMTWLLANNLDYEKASKIRLSRRFPFLEISCLFHPELNSELLEENKDSQERCAMIKIFSESICSYLDQMTERRFIKSHLPLSLLPKNLLTSGCKVIYLARNPKDVSLSFYHFSRLNRLIDFTKDFPTYWDHFSNNLVMWTPYWEHIHEAWERRNDENFLFLFYENMNEDLRGTIRTIQNFLGSTFTEDQLLGLENHLKIENFRKNNSVNLSYNYDLGIFKRDEQNFIRKGETRGSIKYFDEKLKAEADEWIQKHLENTNLKFPNTT